MPLLWKATCMQTDNNIVNDVSTRAEALEIINRSLDRWELLIKFVVSRSGGMKQVLVFPEFNLQGFPLHENAEQWIGKACLQVPGPEVERLQKQAQLHGIFIGANVYEAPPEWPGRYFNCSFLIDPKGDIILKYRRISTAEGASPHDFLDKYVDKHGVEGLFPVAKTELGNISMMPCGEILWPETARCFMMRGAEVMLHPTSDHGTTDFLAWEQAKRVRAAENMMYFISANSGRIKGSIPDGTHVGFSKIIDFQGKEMANSGGAGESTVASAIIDIDSLRRARTTATGAYGVNRIARLRLEAYRKVYDTASFYPPNSFADKPMDSKGRVREILAATIDRLVKKGILTPPSN